MGQKEKLILKLKSNPKTFTFDDAEALLGYFTYRRSNKGRTSGSRVMFTSDEHSTKILLHKPHPGDIMPPAATRDLHDTLRNKGDI